MQTLKNHTSRTRNKTALCRVAAIAALALMGTTQVYGAVKANAVKANVVWSGEGGSSGAGWSTPSTKDIYLKAQTGVAHSGRTALEWHVAAKKQWAECGWEWLGWWPPSRGTDVSAKKKLMFWVRVTGKHKPRDLNVALKSSDKKKQLPTVNVRAYDAKFADGKWHQIKIPLKAMFNAKSDFNPKKASQLFLGTWNEQADFSLYLDDIAFE